MQSLRQRPALGCVKVNMKVATTRTTESARASAWPSRSILRCRAYECSKCSRGSRRCEACPHPSRSTTGRSSLVRCWIAWAYEAGVTLSFIRPGKPVENAYIECFNGRFRDECLNEHWFVSMRHAKQLIEEWRIEYNTERPHSSLGYLTPAQFARAHDAKQQFLTSDSNCSSD
ncbi:transposase [Burkholderia pseudomallei]|nr:transposase [Burkholderia pseudomallei]PNX02442.1 hypothetical protein CF649_15875 [Burkholderia sp. 136(2017)]PNX11085.1 hypothetical protein CF650_32235 [Burkholderia sp. 129]PNX28781.1 hypothetical protein CF647_15915 [Burkholderia sp. 117]PNX37992.1 hypothetical protein CF648_15880 [Burkholderia sp. 137]